MSNKSIIINTTLDELAMIADAIDEQTQSFKLSHLSEISSFRRKVIDGLDELEKQTDSGICDHCGDYH